MDTSNLTEQQTLILFFLYKFRFLTIFHFLKFFNHKNHRRIQIWLADLTKQDLISRDYSRKHITVPAAYFLTTKGIKYLRENRKDIFKPSFQRLNREREKSKPFISHWLFVATIYLKFLELAKDDKVHFLTEIEMVKDKEFLPEKAPDAYIAIEHEGHVVKRYFLKIIDDWLNDDKWKKLINIYMDYSGEGDWEANTGHPFPSILFVAPNEKTKNQIFYYMKNRLEDEITDVSFFVSTRDYIRSGGVKKEVWKKVD
jgi:hypothetical protein